MEYKTLKVLHMHTSFFFDYNPQNYFLDLFNIFAQIVCPTYLSNPKWLWRGVSVCV